MTKQLKNLILVDDDDIMVFLTKRLVAKTNLAKLSQVFGNGEDLINFLKENQDKPEVLPEVIFLDLFMPVMDGWEFLEEYDQIKPVLCKEITIYVITSSVSSTDFNKAKKNKHVSDYIVKPMDKEQFTAIIKSI
ncbi:response regulator [Flavobacterium amniphilum]|uniref:response regulator n=1 Tax=Flavobacterium amniphilum TaxID=1834035 RepID=UPI002029D099|nr:response regulator [Flavobacterium amniphilum]MCL9806530.1 response regulator [Flavobacterium amniphilum]